MNSDDELFKLPRLYTQHPLKDQGVIELQTGQAHYLHNVLRRQNGDLIRLFNGTDGEWIGTLQDLNKKNGHVVVMKQSQRQPEHARNVHLIFSPIKKNRMDWLIEKAVELGVSDFHPVLTQNTEMRKINTARINQQIFEAAEQCERFEIPALHDLQKLEKTLDQWNKTIPLLSCIERYDAPQIKDLNLDQNADTAFLIGPEGGFTADEKIKIAEHTTPVTLGDTILRCETAAIKTLVLLNA